MSQPSAYSKTTNFAQDEVNNVGGRSSVRTSSLDAEFDNVETTLRETLRNLALLQRDDGKLRDGLVELYNLSSQALAALQARITVRGLWAPAVSYAAYDLVDVSGQAYICAVAHTAGTFATDYAAGKWQAFNYQARDVVSITSYGASTAKTAAQNKAAIQAALDSGAKSVYIPSGTFPCASGLVMPNVFGFVLFGDGSSSVLQMDATASALIKWSTSSVVYNEQTIRGIGIVGTSGAGHCIDTSGAGGLTLRNIYITDVPVGFAGVYINGTAATYVHDTRVDGLQVYSNTAGFAGVRCGPLCSDSSVADFIMNGGLVTNYGVYFDAGAVTMAVSNSHIYNASINVVKAAGSNSHLRFSSCILDNATQDIVALAGSTLCSFSDCWFEAIQSGKSGVSITGSANAVRFHGCQWEGVVGAAACVTADNTTSNITATGGDISTSTNYITPFSLAGTLSYARGIAGYNPLALQYYLMGSTTTAQAQNTTSYLGVNGAQSSFSATPFLAPEDSKLVDVYVACDTTPAAGQTFTFTAQVNGVNVGSALTVSNGQFGGVITLNTNVAQNDQIAIKSVFSATSGSSSVRYKLKLTA